MEDHKEESRPNVTFERSKCGQVGDCFIIMVIIIVALLIEGLELMHVNEEEVPESPIYELPNNSETVSTSVLILCVILPWYIIFIFHLILFYCLDNSFVCKKWGTNFFLMNRMLLLNWGITLLLTDIIKCTVGYPRPYFYNADDEMDNNNRLSFPSGHASLSMCSLFLLSFMMYRSNQFTQNIYYKQLKNVSMINCDNPHSYYFSYLWYLLREIPLLSMIIIFIPLMVAIYIGISRIIDYKHFPVDVVTGMLIGIGCALISYSIYSKETYSVFNDKLK
eukprot:303245_1